MTMKNDGGPAFPITAGNQVYAQGMTLRDWFAGKSIMRRWSNGEAMTPEDAAYTAYMLADAMIAARDA